MKHQNYYKYNKTTGNDEMTGTCNAMTGCEPINIGRLRTTWQRDAKRELCHRCQGYLGREDALGSIHLQTFTSKVLSWGRREGTFSTSWTSSGRHFAIDRKSRPGHTEARLVAIWRTLHFKAYSHERWLHYQFSIPHLCISLNNTD